MLQAFSKHLLCHINVLNGILQEGIKLNIHSFDKPSLTFYTLYSKYVIHKYKWKNLCSQGIPNGKDERCSALVSVLSQSQFTTDYH